MSEAHKGEGNFMYGKHHSNEARKRCQKLIRVRGILSMANIFLRRLEKRYRS